MNEIYLLSSGGMHINNSRQNVVYSGVTYTGGYAFEIISLTQNASLTPNECNVRFVYTQDISSASIALSTFASTSIRVAKLNENMANILIEGVVSGVKTLTTGFEIKILNNLHKLTQSITKKYSQMCRASFCDADCTLKIELHTHNNSVLYRDQNIITVVNAIPEKLWVGGALVCQSGTKYTIKSIVGRNIALFENAEITEGESIVLAPTCDKALDTCAKRYNNALNFQGEPFVNAGQ